MDANELRQQLRPRAGGPLPKDDHIKHPLVKAYPWGYRQWYRRIERSSLQALMGSARSRDHQLALKVANCSPTQQCGEVTLCWWCKVRASLTEGEAIVQFFETKIKRDRFSAVTIILACIPYEERHTLRTRLRQIRKRLEWAFRLWPRSQWYGRFELDLLTGHRNQELGSYAEKTLKDMGYAPQSAPECVLVHAHLVIYHPRISRDAVRSDLHHWYSACRQVKVTSLRDEQTTEEALTRFGSYIVKFKPPTFALYGRGSRTFRPRHPDVVRQYVRLQRRVRHENLLIQGRAGYQKDE